MTQQSDTKLAAICRFSVQLFTYSEQNGLLLAVVIDHKSKARSGVSRCRVASSRQRMRHSLGSPYVRDQLSLRTRLECSRPVVATRPYVLYWMQSTLRFEDNWALRFATLEADRVNKPLLIVQTLTAQHTHGSSRFHTFVLQAARELALRSESLGLAYRLLLASSETDGDRHLTALVSGAACVVTDAYPTDGVAQRTARLAAWVPCRLNSVDSVGVIPADCFAREEYSPRTLRPKLEGVLESSSDAIEDRPARRAFPTHLLPALPYMRADAALATLVARSGVTPEPAPVATLGGLAAARARLLHFVQHGLNDYSRRRTNPSDGDGTSRLSAYLRYGMISPLEVMHTTREAGPDAEYRAFADELLTWRALAHNLCVRNPKYASLACVPDWAHQSMKEHASDVRPCHTTLDALERAESEDDVWNAGQRELLATGGMHPLVRMLWGKAVVAWAPTYREAFEWLVYLNDKYSLDARDPASYAGVLWCFGKFDRPFVVRPRWGRIRPMSLERARTKHDMTGYLEQWGHAAMATST